jgi:hypothetical protein
MFWENRQRMPYEGIIKSMEKSRANQEELKLVSASEQASPLSVPAEIWNPEH